VTFCSMDSDRSIRQQGVSNELTIDCGGWRKPDRGRSAGCCRRPSPTALWGALGSR
jgi:hypothetical protein